MNPLKKLFFWRRYTTKQNERYWANRKINWEKDYNSTWGSPHRFAISSILRTFNWFSLIEIGCGSGANIINIIKSFPGRKLQVGGFDVNKDAIEAVNKAIKGGMFRVGSGSSIFMGDKSTDVTLTDMMLVYVGPLKINNYLKEIVRITRNYIVLHEFHHKSWFQRWKLRVFSGRHSYNYDKLLDSLDCYNIIKYKMPVFEEDNDQKFRYIIVAQVPRKNV